MKIIQRYAPEAIKYTTVDKYRGKVLAIDANLMIYKMIFAIRMNGYDIQNGDVVVTHIHALLLKMKGFIKYGITPVFVFDGMPPDIKAGVLKQRKEFQKYMQVKYYKAVTQDEKKKYYFMKSGITYDEIKDCMRVIELFGFSLIEAVEEADAQLAELISGGKVDYVVTDDMDILVFGGGKILKNFTVSDKKKIQEIDLGVLLGETGLSQGQLIDLAILLGCDYCPSVKGIGTIGAYKLIQQHGTLDKALKTESVKLSYDYKKAKEYFSNPPVIDSKKIKINKLKINKKGLGEFLKEFDYKQEYIDKLFSTTLSHR